MIPTQPFFQTFSRHRWSQLSSSLGWRHGLLGAALLLGVSPVLAQATNFGVSGRNGFSGRNGISGRSGQDLVVSVQAGSPQLLRLSGENGSDAERGEYGEDAHSCIQPYPHYSVQGASGGSGGNGGRGGSGGNGGSLLVYTPSLESLRALTVVSEGGRNGRGAPGGEAGRGCVCSRPSWVHRECTPPTQPGQPPTCRESTYFCTNGRDGQRGYDGPDGGYGRMGSLRVVPRLESLIPERTYAATTLIALRDHSETLREQIWETRAGASSVLGSRSILSDTWQHFQGDRVLQVGLRWNSDRPIEDFSQESIELRLDQGRVSWALDPQVFWTSGSVEAPSAATRTVRIDSIYRDTETAKFKIGRVTGVGRALTVEVIDEAQLTGPIQAQFKLKYMSKGRRNWWTINWNQDVPASLVTRNGNRYTIAAGQIPIDDQLKKEGWIVAFEIQATHELGSFRKTKQIDRYWHTIGTTTE